MPQTVSFASTRDVRNAIEALGFVASAETLKIISSTCRELFLNHLCLCVSGRDPRGESQKIIGSVLKCLSPDTLDCLRSVRPDATPDRVVPLAFKKSRRFLSALETACTDGHARQDEARQCLSALLFPAGELDASREDGSRQKPRSATTPSCPVADGQGALSFPVACEPVSDGRRSVPTTAQAGSPGDDKIQILAGKRPFRSCYVYGSSFALCFIGAERDGKKGVRVDAAVSSGPKSYDWKNAIPLWLDINEVGAVLAVFRRWRDSVEFNSHGPQNDPSFSIEFQGKHFFAKLTRRKAENHTARAIKILPADAMAVSIFFLSQLAESYPVIPVPELLATVRATHQI